MCGCSTSYQAQRPLNTERTKGVVYLLDLKNTGNFEPFELEEDQKPQPVHGKDQWNIDFYGSITYPREAREKGIQGLVILDVLVERSGKVVEVNIKESVSVECGQVSRNAFVASTQNGYTPLIVGGIPVPFRMERSVGFWLN